MTSSEVGEVGEVAARVSLVRRLHALDWVAIALCAAGLLCVATGALDASAARDTWDRIDAILLFLLTVVVLAELTAAAGVFDVIASRVANLGRGRYALLFVLCVLFASATTIVLNLDTTAVLLTPVMLALARTVGIAPVPLAMTTVWLANTASLLFPVSNLTNLLAADRVGLSPPDFAARLWAAQLASIAATMAFLWYFYWRRGKRGVDRYDPPDPHVPRDRALFAVAALACLLFVTLVVADQQIQVASSVCAALVLLAFAVRDRAALRPELLPWRLLVMVVGLFLVVGTISEHGLRDLLGHLVGADGGAGGAFRAAATAAGLSNALNNLPAYLAVEQAVAPANDDQLLAALIGTNVGPIITPWASLATLIWYERCHAHGVNVPLRRFVLTGAGLAAVGLVAAVGALLLTR